MGEYDYTQQNKAVLCRKRIWHNGDGLEGHGKSSYINHPEEFTLEKCSNDLESIIDKEKIKKPILVGYSAGGMVAQQYAYGHSDIKALTLIATSYNFAKTFQRGLGRKAFFKFNQSALQLAVAFNSLMSEGKKTYPIYTQKHPRNNSTLNFIIDCLCDSHPDTIQNYKTVTDAVIKWNTYDILKKINAPTQVIAADYDVLMPTPTPYELAGLLQNCKNLTLIENTTHCLPFTHSIKVANAIDEFLNGHIKQKPKKNKK